MKKPLIFLTLGAAVVVGVWLMTVPRTVDPPAPQPRLTAGEPTGTSTRAPRRSLVPGQLPHEAAVVDAGVRAYSRSELMPTIVRDDALEGMTYETLSSGDRERLKLPEKYKGGVRIVQIHPDAPAAEAQLRPDDIIVKAQRDDVTQDLELKKSIGDREHTLLTVYRQGKPFYVVLHKPFRGDPPDAQ